MGAWPSRISPRSRWSPPRSARAPGLGAARVVASHFSVIVRGTAQLFVAGPPVVAMAGMGEAPDKEELGGARAQTAAGAVDNEADDEEDAFAQLKRFLSYLPGSVWEAPPCRRRRPIRPTAARRSCSSIIPRDARQPYDMRRDPRARLRPRLGLRARRAASGGR